jgi:L-ribulokinase
MHDKLVFGVDFGTESARAVLVDAANGEVKAIATKPYAHGVIVETLPGTTVRLNSEWALQDPQDYLDALVDTIRACMKEAGARPEQVIGIGVDFTACTILPIRASGEPLCADPAFRENPHSWVKLWKHHAAEPEANEITELARARGEEFLRYYGGSLSSEWLLPKVLQVLREAPEVYHAADRFVEAGDWIVLQLTGELKRNSCAAGYKETWNKRNGYPSSDFLKALHPDMEHFVRDKIATPIFPVGTYAGHLTSEMARRLGLTEQVAVAVATIDAHASVPGAGIVEPGQMLMVMGTSICHMVMAEEELFIPGVNGVVEDGILPGLYGYEAGQAAGGDTLAWFVRSGVPAAYHQEAEQRGMSLYALLEEKARAIKPGESGLIALDWLNGNRSVLNDASLSGLIVGIRLETKPEEIYLALMESLAFGTRTIIEAFEDGGIPIRKLYACGGLSVNNRLLMQIFANVTGKQVEAVSSPNASALGAAMFGAVAAGAKAGGYDSIMEAASRMKDGHSVVYRPDEQARQTYDRLYRLYKELHDTFGRGSLMKELKAIKKWTEKSV